MSTISVHIQKAIDICGSRTELASHMSVSANAVDKWKREGYVPAHHCKRLSKLTGAPLVELNPFVFDADMWILSTEEMQLIMDLRRDNDADSDETDR